MEINLTSFIIDLQKENETLRKALELSCASIWEQQPPFCNFNLCNDFSNDWQNGKCKDCLINFFKEQAKESLK